MARAKAELAFVKSTLTKIQNQHIEATKSAFHEFTVNCDSLLQEYHTAMANDDSVRRSGAGQNNQDDLDLKGLQAQVSFLETELKEEKEANRIEIEQWNNRNIDLELKFLEKSKEAEKLKKELKEKQKTVPKDVKGTNCDVKKDDETVASLEYQIQDLERKLSEKVKQTEMYKQVIKTLETESFQREEASQEYKIEREAEIQNRGIKEKNSKRSKKV